MIQLNLSKEPATYLSLASNNGLCCAKVDNGEVRISTDNFRVLDQIIPLTAIHPVIDAMDWEAMASTGNCGQRY